MRYIGKELWGRMESETFRLIVVGGERERERELDIWIEIKGF